jgi:hypothetical protein
LCFARSASILNAWVAENRICIGQKRVDDTCAAQSASKSNEITAIPKLIEDLDITDAVVSIDAIGCQHSIAEQIVEKGGDYLLSLKANQRELYDDTVCGFTRTSYVVQVKPVCRRVCLKLGNTTTGVTKPENAVLFRQKKCYCPKIKRIGAG